MGVSKKGRRSIIYKSQAFVWQVGKDGESCGEVWLHIVSDDKSIALSYRVGEGDFHIISKGRMFQQEKTSGCWEGNQTSFFLVEKQIIKRAEDKHMNQNQAYIQNLKVGEVPWHRLTTAYARSADFPKYLDVLWEMEDLAAVKDALKEITSNIEHQSTLWHSTPFAMVFLTRIFEHAFAAAPENTTAYFIVG